MTLSYMLLILLLVLIVLSISHNQRGFKTKIVEYQDMNTGNFIALELTKITSRSFFWVIIKRNEYYFDSDNFYVIKGRLILFTHKLVDVSEFKKTWVKINNSSLWEITFMTKNLTQVSYRFLSYDSIWSQNFSKFYERLSSINPNVPKLKAFENGKKVAERLTQALRNRCL